MEENKGELRDGRTFAQFTEEANALYATQRNGNRIGDLILFPTHQEWLEGTTPQETARKAIEYAESEAYQEERRAYARGMGFEDAGE